MICDCFLRMAYGYLGTFDVTKIFYIRVPVNRLRIFLCLSETREQFTYDNRQETKRNEIGIRKSS